jgi:LysR family transcriptional regulator, carnitine catabolism transcriptional activator
MESLRHLEVFRAVARASSFTRAAEELHVSQPVVSRTVRELERSLGVELFVRTTRSVTLTPEGAELFEIVSDLLDRFDTALERFSAYCRGEYGRVVIATLPSLAAVVLPSILADFLAENPQMRIEILDVTAAEAAHHVQSGQADIAIAAPGPETAALDVQLLLRDRFVAVLPESHALAKRRSVTWQALAAEPFIAMSHGSSVRQLTDLAMAQAGVSPTTVVEARNIATAGGIVAAGLGVSAFPELVLPLMSSTNIATRRLTGPVVHRDIAVITPADQALSPAAQRFVDRLRAGAA